MGKLMGRLWCWLVAGWKAIIRMVAGRGREKSMRKMKRAEMHQYHIPEDPAILQAAGMVSFRHTHLDYELRMTVKTLTGVRPDEAIDATEGQVSGALRRRVLTLAKRILGDGDTFVRLEALIERCKQATEERNRLIHDVCVRDKDGNPYIQTRGRKRQSLPKVEDLSDLWDELTRLTQEVSNARLDGFLAEALKKKINA